MGLRGIRSSEWDRAFFFSFSDADGSKVEERGCNIVTYMRTLLFDCMH